MSEVKKIATRESYGNALVELGAEHDNLIVLDGEKHMLSLQKLCLSMKHLMLDKSSQFMRLVRCRRILLEIQKKIIMPYLTMKSKKELKIKIKMKKSKEFYSSFFR